MRKSTIKKTIKEANFKPEDMKLLINDLVFELKKRAVNAKVDLVKSVLANLNIKNSKEFLEYYGWEKSPYENFRKDYFNHIFKE